MNDTYKAVCGEIVRYCYGKGYREGVGINNFVPHDAIAAYGMAKLLTSGAQFDYYVAVAPEGHIYGYFFEMLGCKTMDLFVPYPPVGIQVNDDLSCIKGRRVLVIEDDVISGRSLNLVVQELLKHEPEVIELYLGHSKGIQHPENVPNEIHTIHFNEDIYERYDPARLECEFQLLFDNSIK